MDKCGTVTESSGCITAETYGKRNSATTANTSSKILINASLANNIYGSSTTVTPLSCKCLYYIKY